MALQHNWFEAKVQYERISPEDGLQKKATDVYLIDALSFTECEARAIEHVRPFTSGELTVSAIKRTKFYEIFDAPTGDRWYKARILFVVHDPENDKEKKTAANMLIQASDLEEARLRLEEGMKGTLSDYEIASITDTKILDVLAYEEKEANEMNEE